jgi:hypothetical protein
MTLEPAPGCWKPVFVRESRNRLSIQSAPSLRPRADRDLNAAAPAIRLEVGSPRSVWAERTSPVFLRRPHRFAQPVASARGGGTHGRFNRRAAVTLLVYETIRMLVTGLLRETAPQRVSYAKSTLLDFGAMGVSAILLPMAD